MDDGRNGEMYHGKPVTADAQTDLLSGARKLRRAIEIGEIDGAGITETIAAGIEDFAHGHLAKQLGQKQ